MKKIFFTAFVAVQILIIFFLGKNLINNRKGKILGTQISPINKDDITFNNDSTEMKHFYEPESGKTVIDKFDWLPTKPVNTINSDSLNERFEYAPEKPKDIFRIITIGDSFTYGAFVNTPDNYPEQLEENLKNVCHNQKFEVINLGVGGYDIQYAVERYKIRGTKYNPDLVIWLMNSWDYTKINELVTEKVQAIINEATVSGTLDKLIQGKGRYYPWTEASNQLIHELGYASISKMQQSYFKSFRESYPGKLLLTIFKDQLNGDITAQKYDEFKGDAGYDSFINNITKNDPNIYIYSDLVYGDLETLKFDVHPNEKDYTLIAKNITDYLTKEHLIKCN